MQNNLCMNFALQSAKCGAAGSIWGANSTESVAISFTVYVYAYICIYTHTYIHIIYTSHIYILTRIYTHVQTSLYVYIIYIHLSVYACMCFSVCAFVFVCVFVNKCVCGYGTMSVCLFACELQINFYT